MIAICRHYCEHSIDLAEFRDYLPTNLYTGYLDRCTQEIVIRFPENAKSWGAARKALNLFFRDVGYNKYLADSLGIPILLKKNVDEITNLEVPLDRDVATALNELFPDLPKCTSIKSLTSKVSNEYQAKAKTYAFERGIARIHLDLEFGEGSSSISLLMGSAI